MTHPVATVADAIAAPILIDTGRGRAQYHLTSAERGVVFDIYGNDEPVRVAWTRPDSDVALLVLDRNGNGQIDSGRELFGSSTRLPIAPGRPTDSWLWPSSTQKLTGALT